MASPALTHPTIFFRYWPWAGLLVWLGWLSRQAAYGQGSPDWVTALLLLAPLIWIPWALRVDGQTPHLGWMGAAVLSFTLAFSLPKGPWAALLAAPWLLWWGSQTWQSLRHERPWSDLRTWLRPAAFGVGVTAAVWAWADRLGVQILDFPPLIGLLTAAHFHYAGFLLMIITVWLLPFLAKRVGQGITAWLLLGIPLTAAGITVTHLGGPIWLETVAATFMAVGGATVAGAHLWLAGRQRFPVGSRIFFAVGGIGLLVGMGLALSYGWHRYLGWDWLTIPWMYRVHGTLNALMLGGALLPGWGIWAVSKRKL